MNPTIESVQNRRIDPMDSQDAVKVLLVEDTEDNRQMMRRLLEMSGYQVSAHDTADFHSEALAAGCNAYITKPIDYPELEDIVNRLVSVEL